VTIMVSEKEEIFFALKICLNRRIGGADFKKKQQCRGLSLALLYMGCRTSKQ